MEGDGDLAAPPAAASNVVPESELTPTADIPPPAPVSSDIAVSGIWKRRGLEHPMTNLGYFYIIFFFQSHPRLHLKNPLKYLQKIRKFNPPRAPITSRLHSRL